MPSDLLPLAGEDHVCADCGVAYAAVDVAAALERISRLPEEFALLTSALPDEDLRRRPDDTTWSVLEYVCHVRDVFAVSTIRLYRTRVETCPVLEPMLNDLRARRFRYNKRDLAAVLGELADNVAGLTDELARYSETDWDRTASRLPGEIRSGRWMVRQAMHEGIHHLGDVGAVIRRLRSAD